MMVVMIMMICVIDDDNDDLINGDDDASPNNDEWLPSFSDVQPSVGKLVLPESTVMYIKLNKVKDMQLKKGGH